LGVGQMVPARFGTIYFGDLRVTRTRVTTAVI
jgi:hypothetical protein